jgi:hypothetical protein
MAPHAKTIADVVQEAQVRVGRDDPCSIWLRAKEIADLEILREIGRRGMITPVAIATARRIYQLKDSPATEARHGRRLSNFRSVPPSSWLVRADAQQRVATEPIVTPEMTLREAGIGNARQDVYQRRMSTLLGDNSTSAPTREERRA